MQTIVNDVSNLSLEQIVNEMGGLNGEYGFKRLGDSVKLVCRIKTKQGE